MRPRPLLQSSRAGKPMGVLGVAAFRLHGHISTISFSHFGVGLRQLLGVLNMFVQMFLGARRFRSPAAMSPPPSRANNSCMRSAL